MIDRYSTKEMSRIWSEQNKYETWKKVEVTFTDILAEEGKIPEESAKIIRDKADFTIDRVHEIEAKTHHDVIAFLTNMAEYIGEDSRYVHMGMTSSDLLDTSLALLCKEAGEIIQRKLEIFWKLLRSKAKEYKDVFQIGRSHGVHAEPITFGLKYALWSEEIKRHIERWDSALERIAVGKISGAVGTYQHLDPMIEEKVCKRLDIGSASVSSQIVQRDRHAEYLNVLALIAASIEKIAVEIRHLQRTEVLEASEYFSKGQKGSSAMPHKKNPIITERMTGFARLIRANAHASIENIALWHERDISHSSIERIIIPDSTTMMDYMLDKMINLIENLIVYPENMMKNINSTKGLVFSQEVLLALVDKGVSREDSYQLVQRNAMNAWDNSLDFKTLVKKDNDITSKLCEEEIDRLFDLDKVLININKIFERIGI